MAHDCQGESAIPAGIGKSVGIGTAKREATQDEGPGIERQLLPAGCPLVADEMDSLDRFEPALGQVNRRQRRADRMEVGDVEIGIIGLDCSKGLAETEVVARYEA